MEEFTGLEGFVPFNPGIFAVVETCKSICDYFERLRFFAYAHYVAGLYAVRGYVHNGAVYGHVFVENQLTGSCTGGGNAQTEYYVVKTRFQKLEQDFTGDTFDTAGFFEQVVELFFEHTVGVFSFLFFTQLHSVFRSLAAFVLAMLAGREVAALEHFVWTEDGFAEFTCYFGLRTCISCHFC